MNRVQVRFEEELRRQELLELFEGLASFLKEKSAEKSFQRLHLMWRNYLYEIMGVLVNCMEAWCSRPFPAPEGENQSSLRPRPRFYTVSYRYWRSQSRFGQDRLVPYIRLSGLWLVSHGFKIGRRFEVVRGTNQLTLRVVGVIDSPPFNDTAEVPNG